MRWNIGRHPDGYPGGAIQQQERQLGGQDSGFLLGVVKVADKIHRRFANFRQHPRIADRGQPGLCIAHCRRRVVVYGAEVSVTAQQGIPTGKLLHHSHQRVIHRLIAVGMVFAEYVTDDSGTFSEGAIGG